MISEEELKKAKKFLLKVDPILGKEIATFKDFVLPVPQMREPYEALIRAIAHQQLHGKAAETILRRFIEKAVERRVKKSIKFPSPDEIFALSDMEIRACGFSLPKILAIRDITEKAQAKIIPTRRALDKLTNEEIIALLVPLRGVGKWTVEMFLIFTLGRVDVLPVDDFGVREGYKVLHKLKAQPTPKELDKSGEKWAPYKSVASLYMWRIADREKEIRKALTKETKVQVTKKK